MKALDEQGIDLVILDIGLPDGNGFDFFREIQDRFSVPVIFLTARSEEVDRVLGLELGGDDYVTKPFSPREVTARVKAVLRRISGGKDASKIFPSGFQVYEDRKRITFFGTPLELSRYVYRILYALIRRPGMVFKRIALVIRSMTRAGRDHFQVSKDKTLLELQSYFRNIKNLVWKRGPTPPMGKQSVRKSLRLIPINPSPCLPSLKAHYIMTRPDSILKKILLTDQSARWSKRLTTPLDLHRLDGKHEDLIRKNLSSTTNCIQEIINHMIESTKL